MAFIKALLKHVQLAMQLEHDGSGLPTHFSSASLFVSLYAFMALIHSVDVSNDIWAVSFIVIVYLYVLRTQLVGLIILIGMISSSISITLGMFGVLSELQLVLLSALEYLLVFGALINAIRRYANLT